MKTSGKTVIGIDVGGHRKGFHAVALRHGLLEARHFTEAAACAAWCLEQDAESIAIDAPCAWAISGGSRLAERSLAISGQRIQCFKTPTRSAAEGRSFFDWVFNGESLYQQLLPHYCLFDATPQHRKIVFETFPHAIACALAGQVISAREKSTMRRQILREQTYDDRTLSNIDFVDAALCAVTAERFLLGRVQSFGDAAEAYIVVPDGAALA